MRGKDAWYNENDPLKAEVLRQAIKAGAIAPGDVDERSIKDVRASELMGYRQCHFFAGGGFWSLALRYAGWPDDQPCWTGSCPCPSFSAAGKGGGFDDPRHLWPYWGKLIGECRPPVVFGEQADDAVGYGWLDLVQTDLEAASYAVGKIVFGACSVGAPHIRQRLYFCADTASGGHVGRWPGVKSHGNPQAERIGGEFQPERRGDAGQCADADDGRRQAGQVDGPGVERGHRSRSNTADYVAKAAVVRATRNSAYADGGEPCDGDLQCGGEQRLLAEDRGAGFGSDAGYRHESERAARKQRLRPDDCDDSTTERGADASKFGRGEGSSSKPQREGGDALPEHGDISGDHTYASGVGRIEGRPEPEGQQGRPNAAEHGSPGGSSDTQHPRLQKRECDSGVPSGADGAPEGQEPERGSDPGVRRDADMPRTARLERDGGQGETATGLWGGLGDTGQLLRERRGPGWLDPESARSASEAGATRGFWSDCDWWYGRDGKYRPIEPGLFPLAHGSAARVGRLRLYGDAIVVTAAAEFIQAYREARGGVRR